MPEDRPVTVTIQPGDVVQRIGAETAYAGVADGRVLLTEPTPWDSDGDPLLLDVGGEEVLMLAGDRVVAIEGPGEAIYHNDEGASGGRERPDLDAELEQMRGGGGA